MGAKEDKNISVWEMFKKGEIRWYDDILSVDDRDELIYNFIDRIEKLEKKIKELRPYDNRDDIEKAKKEFQKTVNNLIGKYEKLETEMKIFFDMHMKTDRHKWDRWVKKIEEIYKPIQEKIEKLEEVVKDDIKKDIKMNEKILSKHINKISELEDRFLSLESHLRINWYPKPKKEHLSGGTEEFEFDADITELPPNEINKILYDSTPELKEGTEDAEVKKGITQHIDCIQWVDNCCSIDGHDHCPINCVSYLLQTTPSPPHDYKARYLALWKTYSKVVQEKAKQRREILEDLKKLKEWYDVKVLSHKNFNNLIEKYSEEKEK